MFYAIVGFIIGLVVGWNFLPQPQWIADFIDDIKSKF